MIQQGQEHYQRDSQERDGQNFDFDGYLYSLMAKQPEYFVELSYFRLFLAADAQLYTAYLDPAQAILLKLFGNEQHILSVLKADHLVYLSQVFVTIFKAFEDEDVATTIKYIKVANDMLLVLFNLVDGMPWTARAINDQLAVVRAETS